MRRCVLTAVMMVFLVPSLWAGSGPGVRVEHLAQTSQSWNAAELPGYPAGQPEVTILRITIPKGAVLPRHAHPVINAGVLLRGELTVETEAGKTLRLHAGEAIVEVVDTWHSGENTGDGPAEIIVFYAGSKGRPITVK